MSSSILAEPETISESSAFSALVLFDPPLCKPVASQEKFDEATAKTAAMTRRRSTRVKSGELNIYDLNGTPLGHLGGYTVKRATPGALLAAIEGVNDLLYEVVWRERALPPGITSADFFPARCFQDFLSERRRSGRS